MCFWLPFLFALLSGIIGWFLKDYFMREKIEEKDILIKDKNHQYLMLSEKLDKADQDYKSQLTLLRDENQNLRVSSYDQKLQIEQLQNELKEKERTTHQIGIAQVDAGAPDPSTEIMNTHSAADSMESEVDDIDTEIISTTQEIDNTDSGTLAFASSDVEDVEENESTVDPLDEEITPSYIIADVVDMEISEYETLIQKLENKNEILKEEVKKRKSKYQKLRSKYNKLVLSYNKQLDEVKKLQKSKEPIQIIKEIPVEITKEVEVKESIDFKKLRKILGDKLPTITSKKTRNKTKKKGKAKIKKIDPNADKS